ncbi:MAG: response regulator transcription factor [Oscillospiraceae bacterium]|nr:response regulator transcription factor [Oscillospiraceae bacterium]
MIYILEDEPGIRNLVTYTLERSGFESCGFGTVAEFFVGIRVRVPSLVLLDIMLPDGDGLEVLKKLRSSASTKKVPVMMLTAKDTEYDKVMGLEAGADDYMPKPFGMMEFIARIKNLMRRYDIEIQSENEFRIGKLYVSLPRHDVLVEDNPVVLTSKEFDVLVYLLRNQGLVLTRDQIMNNVWGMDFDGETRTVDVHIRSLRQKLGVCADIIETVRSVGYKIGSRPKT